MFKFLYLLTVCIILRNASTYKILGIFHFPSKSHHILGSALLKALADRGHDVTMISPFPLKDPYPNYRDIALTGITKFTEDAQFRSFLSKEHTSLIAGMPIMYKYFTGVNEFTLNHTAVKDLMLSGEKFDVLIQSYFGNDAHLGLAYHFDASSIIFSPVGSSDVTTSLTKNPATFSCTPVLFMHFPNKMNFLQRVLNVVFTTAWGLFSSFFNEYDQTHLLNKYLPKTPSLQELRNNVSLVFLNSHFIIEGPRPYLPNMIQVGGLHIAPPKELTAELKAYLDSATDGAILFSLGSNVRSSELPKNAIAAILKTFASISQKVLWKLESTENIHHIPHNVMVSKWLPQSDILAHPNTKAFITHGGLLSITESVYRGIPIVGIPMVGDQRVNINEAVDKGYAVKLELPEISFEKLSWALNEILNNPSYRSSVENLSKIINDNPVSAISKAVYWVEYVIEHNGAHHLKYVGVDMYWYQLYSIDVFLFFLGIFLLLLFGLYYTMYKIPIFFLRNCIKIFKKKHKKIKEKQI